MFRSASVIKGSKSDHRGGLSLCLEKTSAHLRPDSARMSPTLAEGSSIPSMYIAEVGGADSPLMIAYSLARPFFGSHRASSSSFFLSLTLSV